MRPGVKGMAFNACLHPNRPHLLPKMLLRIADDLLGHVVRQCVVRLILDRDTRHGNAPLPFLSVTAACVVTVPLHTSVRSEDYHTYLFLLGMGHLTRSHAEAACMLTHTLRRHVGRHHRGKLRTENGPKGSS